jgi:hypothetical protein
MITDTLDIPKQLMANVKTKNILIKVKELKEYYLSKGNVNHHQKQLSTKNLN